MGGTEAIIGLALSMASTVAGAQEASSQRKQQAARLAQQQQQQALQQRIEERKLERQRKSDLASARARMGAAGTGTDSGSGAAVLQGLNKEYDQQLADSRSLFNAQMTANQNLLDDGPSGLRTALALGQQAFNFGTQAFGQIPDSSSKTGNFKSKSKGPAIYQV